jgi:hypothetical protein
MMSEIVDVTYTVKESVSTGRRLMRNTVSGEEFWVADESDTAEQKPVVVKKAGGRKKGGK